MNPNFLSQTRNAYEHLYDLIFLRTHPLLAMLPGAPATDANGQAWRLHHLLIDAIHQLDPGPKAPIFSREWRRYRLLVRHFEDGIDPQELAGELNISRRQYYREYNLAIEALAESLVQLLGVQISDDTEQFTASGPALTQLQPTCSEETLPNDARCTFNLFETIQGGLQILEEIFKQRRITIELDLTEALPAAAASPGLLRQILLSMLGFLVNEVSDLTITIRARSEEIECSTCRIVLSLAIPADQVVPNPRHHPWQEIATLENLEIHFDPHRPEQVFRLVLPIAGIRRVLAVDDNADILQLYQRFLSTHRYQMIAESNPQRVLEIASHARPDVILLDLMMPGIDGWDVLQSLAHTPETSAIPVIVCSILPQRELAQSLGAAAFLQKPISESILIEAIQMLNYGPE